MITTLPEPDRRKLADAPVNIVVFQLEFAADAPWTPNSGLKWRKALEARGFEGKLLAVQQRLVNIQVGVAAQSETVARAGHQVAWKNGHSAAIYETGLIVESREYSSWPTYRSMLERIIAALEEVRAPQVLQTVTLRYVNALSHNDAHSADYWLDKVATPFLGPYAAESLRPKLAKGLYFLSFENLDDLTCELRIGIQPDVVRAGRVAYVFDMEFTRNEQDDFDVAHVLDVADRMNTAALQMFQQVLTPDYRETLVGAE